MSVYVLVGGGWLTPANVRLLARIIHKRLRRTWKERAIGFALGAPRQGVDGSSSGAP
jgi:hypothetical protein